MVKDQEQEISDKEADKNKKQDDLQVITDFARNIDKNEADLYQKQLLVEKLKE